MYISLLKVCCVFRREREQRAVQEAEERERKAREDAARRQQEMERERQLQQESVFIIVTYTAMLYIKIF